MDKILREQVKLLKEALKDVLPHALATEYHDDWIGNGIRNEACTKAEKILAESLEESNNNC